MKKKKDKSSKQEVAKLKKRTKSSRQLKQEILHYLRETSTKGVSSRKLDSKLKHGEGCVLATSRNNVPRATPTDFFSDGLTIWIAGEPGVKIRNIRSNQRVAVGIYQRMVPGKINRSLQVQGKATLFNLKNHRKVFIAQVKKLGIFSAVEKIVEESVRSGQVAKESKEEWLEKILHRFNLIRVDPEEITYLYIHPTKGAEKNTWKKRNH